MFPQTLRRMLPPIASLLLIASLAAPASATLTIWFQPTAAYEIADLGPADPALAGAGTGINGGGAVVGWARDADGATVALFARAGETVGELGPDGAQSFALDINRVRIVVGWISVRDEATGEDGPIRAARWQGGEATELGALGGDTSVAYGINDEGQIVGGAATGSGNHAFLWQRGEITDLGTLGGADSAAFEISNSGWIVGDSTSAPGQTYGQAGTHAVRWVDGELTDLGTLGGDVSRAFGVNDAGQVVGGSTVVAGESLQHAFLWENGGMTELESLPDGDASLAVDVNADGLIVGNSTQGTDQTAAVLWVDGEIVDLNTLIPAESGIRLVHAGAINDAGQIVCTGVDADGHQRIFLLTPTAA